MISTSQICVPIALPTGGISARSPRLLLWPKASRESITQKIGWSETFVVCAKKPGYVLTRSQIQDAYRKNNGATASASTYDDYFRHGELVDRAYPDGSPFPPK